MKQEIVTKITLDFMIAPPYSGIVIIPTLIVGRSLCCDRLYFTLVWMNMIFKLEAHDGYKE